ncbi:hypothetical protein PSDT_1151 [Parascardovia denticolens DSM 10105 = JCM 12538]|nr:hypothetical protein PSDT_1151 [Parascardovia denticolens DSM 10105 = JCM 12538]
MTFPLNIGISQKGASSSSKPEKGKSILHPQADSRDGNRSFTTIVIGKRRSFHPTSSP